MTDTDKDKLASDTGALEAFNRRMVEEFRATGGHISSLPGGELLLLHHTGARTGEPRLSPLAFVEVDGRMLIIGSSLGSPRDPAWVHNLRAEPHVRIEVGTKTQDITARELPREERDALFPAVCALAPVLADHQAKTERVIPLFELTAR